MTAVRATVGAVILVVVMAIAIAAGLVWLAGVALVAVSMVILVAQQ